MSIQRRHIKGKASGSSGTGSSDAGKESGGAPSRPGVTDSESGSEPASRDSLFSGEGATDTGAHKAQSAPSAGEHSTDELGIEAPEGRSWKIAADIINEFRPVPRLLWSMIHGVYGKAGEVGQPDSILFSPVSPLLFRAVQDRTLAPAKDAANSRKSLAEAVQQIGLDVAGSVCFVHSICRRVSKMLSERVSRPILDDALLRAHIGYFVGKFSTKSLPGSGMIAGFSGRSGLAIQMAWGNEAQGQKALTGMASGEDMSEVCAKVYGCDPLEVAALALIAGGCSRDIAFGISAYSVRNKQIVPGTEQYRWLTLFSVIEQLRMGRWDEVSDADWNELGYSSEKRQELQGTIDLIQRRGHGWAWLTQPQLS